ncbi:MAG: hypothetical protein HY815_12675 [Candidatus Riflebacteria bacterium]|nr:hypothetical protein [Candidatus Riflebacteria bacterium]
MQRDGPDVKGPPTRMTFTLMKSDERFASYPAPVSAFAIKIELLGTGKPRKVTLRRGEGNLWFDRTAGILVRSKIALAFDEESTPPGAPGPRVTTYSTTSDWELVTK